MLTIEEITHTAELTPWVGHWRCDCGYVGTDDMMNRHMAENGWCSECWGSGSDSYPSLGRCHECGGSGERDDQVRRSCPDCREGTGCYVHDPGYRLYIDEETAIHEGLAMRLTHCYLCYLEATGKPDMSPKMDQGPLRGVIGEKTVYGFDIVASKRVGFDGDPYSAVKLTCGHSLI